MLAKISGAMCVLVCFALVGLIGDAQEKKQRTGSLIGEIKSQKPTPNGKNVIVEILAPGEERPRPYRVQYDPKAKGPIPTVLEAVKAAKVGDRAQIEWVDTGEGLAIKTFQVLKKDGDSKKEEAKKTATIIGELKSRHDTKDGKNSIIEVLAPGEEKARSYHVMYDAKIKGPITTVLKSVREAKIGDRVEFDWISTGHGPAITAFKVFRAGAEK